jgi:hypothetical protein
MTTASRKEKSAASPRFAPGGDHLIAGPDPAPSYPFTGKLIQLIQDGRDDQRGAHRFTWRGAPGGLSCPAASWNYRKVNGRPEQPEQPSSP